MQIYNLFCGINTDILVVKIIHRFNIRIDCKISNDIFRLTHVVLYVFELLKLGGKKCKEIMSR